MNAKETWKSCRAFFKGVKGVPSYYFNGIAGIEELSDVFCMPDAMHALAGLLHKIINIALARLTSKERKLFIAWAKENDLYHSSGNMYCYSWIVYAIHSVLPRHLSHHVGGVRPVDLPETSRNFILCTLDLRKWLYFCPVAIRNAGNIFAAHGALIHFLHAADKFNTATCSHNCKCTAGDGCFPGKDSRTTIFGGANGGGVYIAGVRSLILLLRLIGAIPALCETSESFFKHLKAMLTCTNKQWHNVVKIVKRKINGTLIEFHTNLTDKMIAGKEHTFIFLFFY